MNVETPIIARVGDPVRLDALADYGILDTPPEKGFDDIVQLVRVICAAPVALVSLVAGDRQWFKAKAGFAACETSLDRSVCAHALTEPELLVIPDLTQDPRTHANPLVTGEPNIRFYAGAPLTAANGARIGSLCVIDLVPRPRGLTEEQAVSLRALADQVMALMELRRSATERDKTLARQTALIEQQKALIETQAAVSNAAGDRDAILDALVAGAMRAVPQADGGVIELRDGEELVYHSGQGRLARHIGLRLPLLGSLSGHCLLSGRPILCPDALRDPRVKRDLVETLGLRSCIVVPVRRDGSVIGVLKLQSGRPDTFGGNDLQVARLFAGTVAAGLAEAGEAEARRRTHASEATLRAVLDTLPVGVLIAESPSGRIVGHNARVEAILRHEVLPSTPGTGSDQWVGYHADGSPVAPDEWPLVKVTCDGMHLSELEVDYQRGDGTRSWIAFSGAPMHDADGRLTGGVVVVADIDVRKRVERELEGARAAAEGANHAKSDFLANMSHELRTPLTALIGYAEMVQEELEDAGQGDIVPDVKKIEANARHLLGLINDVLDLSKIEAGQVELYAETFDVAALARDVASTVAGLVAKRGNVLDVTLADDLGTAHTDATKLRQCLFNLLGNAAKFTEGGRITLAVSRALAPSGDTLRLTVSDTGIGMSQEQMARLFGRYAQAEASTSRNYGGTGLGLAITHAFAGLLGGGVTVESHEGAGTTFTLLVPMTLPIP